MASEFTVRPDSVDVEQIMGRIRARISETRGTDYTEKEIRDVADVTIAKLLDPTTEGPDLLTFYLKRREEAEKAVAPGKARRGLLWLLSPVLRPFIKLNSLRHAVWELRLNFALIHNLIIEVTRAGIEIRNLKMRVESLSTRLDFSERRARSLEHAAQPRAAAPAHAAPATRGGSDRGGSDRGGSDRGGSDRGGSDRGVAASQPSLPLARQDAAPAEGSAKGDAQRRRRRRRRGRGSAGGPGPVSVDGADRDGTGQEGAGSEPDAAGPAPNSAPSTAEIPDRDTTDQ